MQRPRVRPFKFSGIIPPGDVVHAQVAKGEETTIAPTWVSVPGGSVPQYAPTAKQAPPTTYAPSTDCNGNFMSFRYQPNNNCYNYGCDIATSSFAQPGRMHGVPMSPFTPAQVVKAAVADGLQDLGPDYPSSAVLEGPGHVVALMFSEPDASVSWPGDFHWARYDQEQRAWSQKDGGDQVTNFDFAGQPLANPATANWTVNQGPSTNGGDEYIVSYQFVTFMLVPPDGVNII